MSHGNAEVVTRPSGADASKRGSAAHIRGNLHEGIALVDARAVVLLAAARLNTEMTVGGVLHPRVLLRGAVRRPPPSARTRSARRRRFLRGGRTPGNPTAQGDGGDASCPRQARYGELGTPDGLQAPPSSRTSLTPQLH